MTSRMRAASDALLATGGDPEAAALLWAVADTHAAGYCDCTTAWPRVGRLCGLALSIAERVEAMVGDRWPLRRASAVPEPSFAV